MKHNNENFQSSKPGLMLKESQVTLLPPSPAVAGSGGVRLSYQISLQQLAQSLA